MQKGRKRPEERERRVIFERVKEREEKKRESVQKKFSFQSSSSLSPSPRGIFTAEIKMPPLQSGSCFLAAFPLRGRKKTNYGKKPGVPCTFPSFRVRKQENKSSRLVSRHTREEKERAAFKVTRLSTSRQPNLWGKCISPSPRHCTATDVPPRPYLETRNPGNFTLCRPRKAKSQPELYTLSTLTARALGLTNSAACRLMAW